MTKFQKKKCLEAAEQKTSKLLVVVCCCKTVEIIRKHFDLRPAGIIRMLDLRRPIYRQTAAYGHFGRNDLKLPWEATDKVEELKKYL